MKNIIVYVIGGVVGGVALAVLIPIIPPTPTSLYIMFISGVFYMTLLMMIDAIRLARKESHDRRA